MYKLEWIITPPIGPETGNYKFFPREEDAHAAYRAVITASGVLGIADWITTINLKWEEEQ